MSDYDDDDLSAEEVEEKADDMVYAFIESARLLAYHRNEDSEGALEREKLVSRSALAAIRRLAKDSDDPILDAAVRILESEKPEAISSRSAAGYWGQSEYMTIEKIKHLIQEEIFDDQYDFSPSYALMEAVNRELKALPEWTASERLARLDRVWGALSDIEDVNTGRA